MHSHLCPWLWSRQTAFCISTFATVCGCSKSVIHTYYIYIYLRSYLVGSIPGHLKMHQGFLMLISTLWSSIIPSQSVRVVSNILTQIAELSGFSNFLMKLVFSLLFLGAFFCTPDFSPFCSTQALIPAVLMEGRASVALCDSVLCSQHWPKIRFDYMLGIPETHFCLLCLLK